MNNNEIEKNFKDKLESYGSFEGDRMAMWENIERELEEKKNRKFIWLWLFPILLGVIGGTWFVFGKNKTTIVETTTTTKQDIYKNKNTPLELKTELNNNTSTTKEKIITTKNISEKTKTIQQQQINDNTYSAKLKLFNTTSLSSDFSNEREQNLTHSKNLVQVQPRKDELKILKNELAIHLLPALNLPFLNVVNDVPAIDTVMFWNEKNLNPESKPNPWSIRIGGGVNSMTTGFNNTSTDGVTHSKNLTPQLGWNFIFEIERAFPKDFYLTSGVHFNRNWLRFKYNSTTITPIILDDVVLRYDINLLSGDTTAIIGDTILERITTRDIQHHNQYDKFKIPILFGKRWKTNRFSYGGSAGIGLDFWKKQSGRYLSEDEFGSYDSDADGNALPKLGWSAELRGDFSFEIKKKVSFFAQPYLSVAIKNWSIIGDEAIQKPTVFGTNFGLQIKF